MLTNIKKLSYRLESNTNAIQMKPRRNRTVTVRLSDAEFNLLEKLATSNNVDNSDVLRLPLNSAITKKSPSEWLDEAASWLDNIESEAISS